MGKSKYRKKSEIKNARELPENILAKITQLKMQLNQKILTYLQNLFHLKFHLLKIFI